MVNNIRNNTISEISAKEGLNTLNEIKNTEIIKYKKHTPTQKELLNLFKDLLDTILIDKILLPLNQKGNENGNGNGNEKGNEKGNENGNENGNGNGNENGNENGNKKEKENGNEKENEEENEEENENENNKTLILKQLNGCLDEIIGKSKSFEDQIESIRKIENLDEYYFMSDMVIKN